MAFFKALLYILSADVINNGVFASVFLIAVSLQSRFGLIPNLSWLV